MGKKLRNSKNQSRETNQGGKSDQINKLQLVLSEYDFNFQTNRVAIEEWILQRIFRPITAIKTKSKANRSFQSVGRVRQIIWNPSWTQGATNLKPLRATKNFLPQWNASPSLHCNKTWGWSWFIAKCIFHDAQRALSNCEYSQLRVEVQTLLYETQSLDCQCFCYFGLFLLERPFRTQVFMRGWRFRLWPISRIQFG